MLFEWLSHAKRRVHASTRKPQRRLRPCLEALEDRLTPATWKVTTTADVVDSADGKLSLREAISRANANPGLDTIMLATGIYKTTLPGHESFNAAGDFNIQDSVTIVGASARATVIDGQQLDRVFDIFGSAPSSIRVTFQGVTVRGGLNDTFFGGGGILVGNADLVVRDCVVTGNRTALAGGGISNAYAPGTGKVTLVRSTVSRNVADGNGGGLYVAADAGGQGGNLTVKGSTVRRNLSNAFGGGISARTVTLTGSTVSGNAADYGGGINAVTASLTNSRIEGNTADTNGGGIHVTGDAHLTLTTVSGNTADESGGGMWASTTTLTDSAVVGNQAGGSGGGILALETATLAGSTVSGNRAFTGGGISVGGISAGMATLTDSIVSGNTSIFRGGGIFVGGVPAGTATLTNSIVSGNSAGLDSGGGIHAGTADLTGCTVSGNYAGTAGGGIRADFFANLVDSTVSGNVTRFGDGGGINATTASLLNTTVSGNHASSFGGGIRVFGPALLFHVTITDNSAESGGGGVYRDPSGSDPISVKNSIIAQNLVAFGGSGPDVSGAFTSLGFNLIGDPTGSTGFGATGDILGTAEDPRDPGLGPLADNGGRTLTHALLSGSPAIDAGDNLDAPRKDQRGVRRPRHGDGKAGGIVDIGAFEK